MKGRVVKYECGQWHIQFENGCTIEVDRCTGELRKLGSPEDKDAESTSSWAAKPIIQTIDFRMLAGYTVIGSEGMMLLITKEEANGRYPGWPAHQVNTVVSSQWLRIQLVDPMTLVLTAENLSQHLASSTPAAKMEASDDDDISSEDLPRALGSINDMTERKCEKNERSPRPEDAKAKRRRKRTARERRPHIKANLAAVALLARFEIDGTFFWSETCDPTSHFMGSPPCASDGVVGGSDEAALKEPVTKKRLCQEEMWSVCNMEFVWNESLAEPFALLGIRSYCPVLLRGMCVTSSFTDTSGAVVNQTMVTRMRNLNPGSRYDARGLHHTQAGVGNEYESEVILYQSSATSVSWTSIACSRGTVPVRWSQKLKKAAVSASLAMDPQPYRGVPQYWNGIWERYGTSKFLCVNLLRSNATPTGASAAPASQSPQGSWQWNNMAKGGSGPVSPTTGLPLFLEDGDVAEGVLSQGRLAPATSFSHGVRGEMDTAQESLEVISEAHTSAVLDSLLGENDKEAVFLLTEALARGTVAARSWRELDNAVQSTAALEQERRVKGTAPYRSSPGLTPPNFPMPMDVGERDKLLGVDDDAGIGGNVFDEEDSDEEQAEAAVPTALVDSAAAQESERVRALNEGGVMYKGEPLLSYVFESSLHALDRKLERQNWEKKGVAPTPQSDRMKHCAPTTSEEADFDQEDPNRLLRQPQNHNTHIRHLDWHGNVKKVGDKKTAEYLWKVLHPYVKEFGYSTGEMTPGDDPETFTIRKTRIQTGVYRFNCADSLDRTNLALFYLCVQVLNEGMRLMLKEGPEEDDWGMMMMDHDRALSQMHKTMVENLASSFVANGDVCASIYCNSQAMHSGRLRSLAAEEKQKRKKTNIEITIQRRYQNQFSDHKRTRCLYSFLGRETYQDTASYRKLKATEVSRAVVITKEKPIGYVQGLSAADGLVTCVLGQTEEEIAEEALIAELEVVADGRDNTAETQTDTVPSLPVVLLLFATVAQAEQCVYQDSQNRYTISPASPHLNTYRMLVNSARYVKYQEELLQHIEQGTTKARYVKKSTKTNQKHGSKIDGNNQ